MLRWLVSTSLRLRLVVVALAGVLVILGIRTVRKTPMDVFPGVRAAARGDPDGGSRAIDGKKSTAS